MCSVFHTGGVRFASQKSWLVAAIKKNPGSKLSQSYLSQIESGAHPHLTNSSRMLLAKFFNVHPGYLVDDPEGYHTELMSDVRATEDRLERRGLKLAAAKFLQVSQELAETHYAIHKGKPFYNGLIDYITSAPVMAMVWQGPNAITAIRQTMGATRPTEAEDDPIA